MRHPVIVEAPCGRIAGRERRGILRFLGVPYGEAPTGPLRFAAPTARARFEEVHPAFDWGPAALQRALLPGPVARVARQTAAFSEDSLNLHVFTPGLEGRRPVLVFIHGGGFVLGSGAQYPGDDLARRGDAVVVTLNYRLGFFGFNAFDQCFHGDERFAANAGLLDQRLALAWVRENIASFGGDPARVTLAGESAGAASVAFHLVSERSRGLFRQAILQSGGLNLLYEKRRAGAVADAALEDLGTGRDAEALLALPPERLAETMRRLAPEHFGIVSRPHVDGVDVPDLPLPALHERAARVPLLIGTNRDEFTLFSDLDMFPIDGSRESLLVTISAMAGEDAAARIAQAYGDTRRDRIDLGTDAVYRMPAAHFASRMARHEPTYVYRLDFEARGYLRKLGATHSMDLPLLFEDFLRPFRAFYFGVLPDPRRAALAERMRERWMNFVRDGEPGGDWPRYEPETRRIQVFDAVDRIETEGSAERLAAWEGVDAFLP